MTKEAGINQANAFIFFLFLFKKEKKNYINWNKRTKKYSLL